MKKWSSKCQRSEKREEKREHCKISRLEKRSQGFCELTSSDRLCLFRPTLDRDLRTSNASLGAISS